MVKSKVRKNIKKSLKKSIKKINKKINNQKGGSITTEIKYKSLLKSIIGKINNFNDFSRSINIIILFIYKELGLKAPIINFKEKNADLINMLIIILTNFNIEYLFHENEAMRTYHQNIILNSLAYIVKKNINISYVSNITFKFIDERTLDETTMLYTNDNIALQAIIHIDQQIANDGADGADGAGAGAGAGSSQSQI